MRSAVVACLFIALSVLSAEARLSHNRDILGDATSKSGASATGNGKGTETTVTAGSTSYGGVSSAYAEGYAEVDTEAVNAVAVAITDAYAEIKEGAPVKAAVNAQATAVGKAFALAYARAYATVFSNGEGNTACAKVFSSGEAAATAFAEAYARGVAAAKNKYGKITAKGAADAFAAATARAYAAAEAEVCVNGKGKATATQESLAVSLVRPIATAMVKAFVAVDSYGATTGHVQTESKSDKTDEETFAATTGHAGVETYDGGHGTAYSGGQADAVTEKVQRCSGFFGYKCCNPYKSSSKTCGCSYGYSKSCLATLTQHKVGYNTRKVWEVTKSTPYSYYPVGYQCICY